MGSTNVAEPWLFSRPELVLPRTLSESKAQEHAWTGLHVQTARFAQGSVRSASVPAAGRSRAGPGQPPFTWQEPVSHSAAAGQHGVTALPSLHGQRSRLLCEERGPPVPWPRGAGRQQRAAAAACPACGGCNPSPPQLSPANLWGSLEGAGGLGPWDPPLANRRGIRVRGWGSPSAQRPAPRPGRVALLSEGKQLWLARLWALARHEECPGQTRSSPSNL